MPENSGNTFIHPDGLDLRTPWQTAQPGSSRIQDNLRPRGSSQQPQASPVAAPGSPIREQELSPILSLHHHQRRQIGGLSDVVSDPDQSQSRIIAVRPDDILIVDPALNHQVKVALGLGANPYPYSPSRKTVSAQVGPQLFLADSIKNPDRRLVQRDAAGITEFIVPEGFPEPVLVVRDDHVMQFDVPDLPCMEISYEVASETPDVGRLAGLEPGVYAFRFRWRLKDGSLTNISPAYIRRFPTAFPVIDATKNWRYRPVLRVAVEPDIPYWWQHVISGVLVEMTLRSTQYTRDDPEADPAQYAPEDSHIDDLLDRSPFYAITEIRTDPLSRDDFTGNWQQWKTTWADNNENIPGSKESQNLGISLVNRDDDMMIHRNRAGTSFSHNDRLLLGDHAIDFRKLDCCHFFEGVFVPTPDPADPPVCIVTVEGLWNSYRVYTGFKVETTFDASQTEQVIIYIESEDPTFPITSIATAFPANSALNWAFWDESAQAYSGIAGFNPTVQTYRWRIIANLYRGLPVGTYPVQVDAENSCGSQQLLFDYIIN